MAERIPDIIYPFGTWFRLSGIYKARTKLIRLLISTTVPNVGRDYVIWHSRVIRDSRCMQLWQSATFISHPAVALPDVV